MMKMMTTSRHLSNVDVLGQAPNGGELMTFYVRRKCAGLWRNTNVVRMTLAASILCGCLLVSIWLLTLFFAFSYIPSSMRLMIQGSHGVITVMVPKSPYVVSSTFSFTKPGFATMDGTARTGISYWRVKVHPAFIAPRYNRLTIGSQSVHRICIPLWIPPIIFIVISALLYHRLRRNFREAIWFCTSCGYDFRGSPVRVSDVGFG